jgi:hypothetical protein
MACVSYPKWNHAILPSRDEIHIFRDPPKSIHTRKKERVEFGDVSYNLRDDESRLQDAIRVYARGVNPSVEVNYSNLFSYGGSTVGGLPQTRNPYTVNSAFRPPLFRQEDLLPLSRLRRPYTYGITNPGVRPSFVNEGLEQAVDKQPIQSAISVVKLGTTYPYIIQPTAVYRIAYPIEVDGKYAVREEVLSAPVSSAYSSGFLNNDTARDIQEKMKYKVIKDDVLAYTFNATPSLNIETHPDINADMKGVKDETLLSSIGSNVSALSDITNDNDLSGMKLQDNMNLPVFSTPHSDKKVYDYNPEYEFKKHSPLDSYHTSISGDKQLVNHNEDVVIHNKIVSIPHSTNPKIYYEKPDGIDERDRKRRVKHNIGVGEFSNGGTIHTGFANKNAKLKERKVKK